MSDSFGARSILEVGGDTYEYFSLAALEKEGISVARLPYSLRILIENLLRTEDGVTVTAEDIRGAARWDPAAAPSTEIAFTPGRVLLQDFTGVPAVVDLAAMRAAMAALGGDPTKINPLQPVELVIDHSFQIDAYGTSNAININTEMEYERNQERYTFLRWGQQAFENFKVVPPNMGICHQVNLEYLARVVFGADDDRAKGRKHRLAYPDTLVGTDSHTPMVNGLGVLGWGVGGIEAEAAMLGQAISLLMPQVVGFRVDGELAEGATATDLVLTVAQLLRKHGVVGKFVEFYGPGIAALPTADRATIGNMSPEYGATCAIFPVDAETLRYLRFTGRSKERVALVEAYMKEQGLFHTADSPEPQFTTTLQLDLSTVEPSIAGPRRPQDRIPLSKARQSFASALPDLLPTGREPRTMKDSAEVGAEHGQEVGTWGQEEHEEVPGLSEDPAPQHRLRDGDVVIASITSCTNTSNPSVMMAAGLLAKKAVERGLKSQPWVKTSLAPGSRVVTEYYEKSGLLTYLEQLGFHVTGYGCATCIGNSGPLPTAVSEAVAAENLVVCSVLSGNRNFEGRIHSEVRANYLMSPPLVVAYALAGRMDVDLYNEPIGTDRDGRSVFLKDIWPTQHEVREIIESSIQSDMYSRSYGRIFEGDEKWRALESPTGDLYDWQPDSTYVRHPPYFQDMERDAPETVAPIVGARAIALLGDSITTDHISPAGSIKKDSPAGHYLVKHGVQPKDFNSYGSRRGNDEVMVRGTFANVRIRNRLAPGTEGGFTTHLPTGDVVPIYDAAQRYKVDGTPLIVLAGKEYGSGSSRDWAAKGPYLQGIRAAIAESYERIHRSNLIGMGILPLQFPAGETADSLGLDGRETFEIVNLQAAVADGFKSGRELTVRATSDDGRTTEFRALVRIDTPQEVLYYRNGGILQYVLRQLLTGKEEKASAGIATAPAHAPDHTPTQEEVDEGSIESFPASDPPSY